MFGLHSLNFQIKLYHFAITIALETGLCLIFTHFSQVLLTFSFSGEDHLFPLSNYFQHDLLDHQHVLRSFLFLVSFDFFQIYFFSVWVDLFALRSFESQKD